MELDLHFLQARYTRPIVSLCVWRSIGLNPMCCIKCTLQRSALWSALVHFIPVKGLIAFYLGKMYKSHMSFISPQNSFKTANNVLPIYGEVCSIWYCEKHQEWCCPRLLTKGKYILLFLLTLHAVMFELYFHEDQMYPDWVWTCGF